MMYEAVLQGILFAVSILEVWLCYQLFYYLIIEKKYLCTKEKIIGVANIVIMGGDAGLQS